MAEDPPRYELNARIHQATEILMAHWGYSFDEALEQLLERVEASGKTLDEIAADVIRFDA